MKTTTIKASDLVYSCSVAMYNYLKNSDLQVLLDVLIELQGRYCLIHSLSSNIWFRFGTDDTQCTTIGDIEKDLSLPNNHNNHKFMVERFEMVCNSMDANKELEVYFS